MWFISKYVKIIYYLNFIIIFTRRSKLFQSAVRDLKAQLKPASMQVLINLFIDDFSFLFMHIILRKSNSFPTLLSHMDIVYDFVIVCICFFSIYVVCHLIGGVIAQFCWGAFMQNRDIKFKAWILNCYVKSFFFIVQFIYLKLRLHQESCSSFMEMETPFLMNSTASWTI